MLKSSVVRIVEFCSRQPWLVVVVATLLALTSGMYAARHFAITTNINNLISHDLPFRQREIAFDKVFPNNATSILAVVEAPTPELTEQATDKLVQGLKNQPKYFHAVHQAGGGSFFERNGLLFLSQQQLAHVTDEFNQAEPILTTLATDPSLRGITDALTFGILGVQGGQLKIDQMVWPMSTLADTLDNVIAGKPASFSWRVLADGKPAAPDSLRSIIETEPILDFGALEPGAEASNIIRKTAADLHLANDFQARVRLTGSVALADEEFSTLKEGALLNGLLTIAAVLAILWLALRSARLILAVFLSLMAGLAITAALGLMMVGAFNLISVAFAVLFVGLGVDFGLQFSVRYRAERHDYGDLHKALRSGAEKAGGPLALAAAATAAGFLSFLPTAYRGLAELGQVAGCGMLIAFISSITLLPALLSLFNSPGEAHPLGYRWLAPVDLFLERHRIPVIALTALVVAAGSPLLFHMRFDFNPMNLRSAKVESVATYFDLEKARSIGVNAIQILAPSLSAAEATASRVATLPEVSSTVTLKNFVPDNQKEKLDSIAKAATVLEPALNPQDPDPPPSDEENIQALSTTANGLLKIAGTADGAGNQAAKRLAGLFSQLAKSDAAARKRAEMALVPSLKFALDQLRSQLKPQTVSLQTLPADLVTGWQASDGRARVMVMPSGDPNNNDAMRSFSKAVLAMEPNATGAPVSIQESGDAIVRAFAEAGFWALLSITILLWITLRRIGDVLLTLVPLLMAGVVTVEICVLIGLQFNFANIIALPLLLGVGVAFKIYYIMAWRTGKTRLLQSTLTHAVVCSALTTATAFGSLWMSNHPGTSSMGKLMALSLVCTMAAAVLFQPVLMGPPRDAKASSDKP